MYKIQETLMNHIKLYTEQHWTI